MNIDAIKNSHGQSHANNPSFILEKDGIPIVDIMGADELGDYLELKDPNAVGVALDGEVKAPVVIHAGLPTVFGFVES